MSDESQAEKPVRVYREVQHLVTTPTRTASCPGAGIPIVRAILSFIPTAEPVPPLSAIAVQFKRFSPGFEWLASVDLESVFFSARMPDESSPRVHEGSLPVSHACSAG